MLRGRAGRGFLAHLWRLAAWPCDVKKIDCWESLLEYWEHNHSCFPCLKSVLWDLWQLWGNSKQVCRNWQQQEQRGKDKSIFFQKDRVTKMYSACLSLWRSSHAFPLEIERSCNNCWSHHWTPISVYQSYSYLCYKYYFLVSKVGYSKKCGQILTILTTNLRYLKIIRPTSSLFQRVFQT